MSLPEYRRLPTPINGCTAGKQQTGCIQMPNRARVTDFVAMVVSGDHVGAIEHFYHEDATMQENRTPPRRGRDVLMAHEARALSRIKHMHTHPAEVIVVDGDNVAI